MYKALLDTFLRPSIHLGYGTRSTAADPDAFCVTSPKATCLLASGSLGEEAEIDLKGYCDMETMLDFRLNKEPAIVMVSSLKSEGGSRAAAVEFVRKIEPHCVSQWKALFDVEWKDQQK